MSTAVVVLGDVDGKVTRRRLIRGDQALVYLCHGGDPTCSLYNQNLCLFMSLVAYARE